MIPFTHQSAAWSALVNADRLRTILVSAAAKTTLGSLGSGSRLQPPVKLHGVRNIHIGRRVHIGAGSWLEVLDPNGRLEVGHGVRATGALFVSAMNAVVIEDYVLIGRFVHIADHSHATADPVAPIMNQGVTGVAPVRVGTGAWIGQSVVMLPGTEVGAGAVVAANSVVSGAVPPRSVAAGAPARIVAHLAGPEG